MTAPRCTRSPGCEWDAGHLGDHPCGQKAERPGEPCRYCTKPVPPEGTCLDCWAPITIADAKAMFASYGLSVDIAMPEELS